MRFFPWNRNEFAIATCAYVWLEFVKTGPEFWKLYSNIESLKIKVPVSALVKLRFVSSGTEFWLFSYTDIYITLL